MKILPLRNMVLVRLAPNGKSAGQVQVVGAERAICRFTVVACGPEVRDVKIAQTVLANKFAATQIGDEYLLPDSAVLAWM